MKFYSRELSKKLQDMGCVATSGFYWIEADAEPMHGVPYFAREWDYVPAFTPYDFCGPSEQARKNARIVANKSYTYFRHEMIEAEDSDAFITKWVDLGQSAFPRKHKCLYCGKEFAQVKASLRIFCERSCTTQWQTMDPTRSHNWTGDNPSYAAVHLWVRSHYKKGDKCEHCGLTERKGKIGQSLLHWANKSGNYKRNRDDWLILCINCHWKYDKPWLKRKRSINGDFA